MVSRPLSHTLYIILQIISTSFITGWFVISKGFIKCEQTIIIYLINDLMNHIIGVVLYAGRICLNISNHYYPSRLFMKQITIMDSILLKNMFLKNITPSFILEKHPPKIRLHFILFHSMSNCTEFNFLTSKLISKPQRIQSSWKKNHIVWFMNPVPNIHFPFSFTAEIQKLHIPY